MSSLTNENTNEMPINNDTLKVINIIKNKTCQEMKYKYRAKNV